MRWLQRFNVAMVTVGSVVVFVGLIALAQGPGGYNPVGPGVSLAGNVGPVFHEDQHERGPGPELVNFLGIPLTDGARMYGLAWDASRFTIPEHQCEVHIVSYIYRGPYNLRIWEERDPVSQKLIAIKQYLDNYQQTRTIWMDDRPHPSEAAPHTWMGFSTGKWEGNILTVNTTHLKWGWIRRNGLRHTDQATLTEHFIRHGDHLTLTSVLSDPITLTEPLVRTTDLMLRVQNGQTWLYPCESVVEIDRPAGTVPHYQPGSNPFFRDFAEKKKIPGQTALGGAETIYPEYQATLKKTGAK